MRTLESALGEHDLVTLQVMGEWWELDLLGADKAAAIKALAETLSAIDFAMEFEFLPPEEAAAIRTLVDAGGRLPVGTFTRQHGEVRQMGPGRLEREEPWFDPVSPSEALWYRGFLYRGFDEGDDGQGLVEYYYLPQELIAQFAQIESEMPSHVDAEGPPVADPPATADFASATAVDDLTSILAHAQRDDLEKEGVARLAPFLFNGHPARCDLLMTLARELGLLREIDGRLHPTRPAVEWLKLGREEQMRALAEAWSSSNWNELCHTPGLLCEGSGWSNDPLAARATLLERLPHSEQWYSVDALVARVKENDPDFQRPEGNYDTWYIRDAEEGAYLKGFESWDRVEGRLLRFLIEGPMAWLGLTDTGEARYRLTERALAWLEGRRPEAEEVRVPLVVQADATLLVPHNANRHHRFQVARVALPEPLQPGMPYQYRLTPASLQGAREEGIQPERVLEFLGEASGRPIPASVRRAVERWAERGLEGRLQSAAILRVRDSAILDTLQANARTRPFLGERLGELAAVVRADNLQELQKVTAQLGLLLDIHEE